MTADEALDADRDEVRDAFAMNVRAARVKADLRQEDIAFGMRKRGFKTWSRATVSEVELSKRGVLVEEVVALAKVLDTSVSKLLTRPAVPEEIVELVAAFGGRIVFEKGEAKELE